MKNQLVVYGKQVVRLLLDEDSDRVATLFFVDTKSTREFVHIAKSRHISTEKVNSEKMNDLCADGVHQGVAVLLKSWPYSNEEELYKSIEDYDAGPKTLLVLDSIQDPHNLGACLRTADAAGVSGVIVPKDNSSKLNAIVCKVSCGAVFTVPIYRVTNIARAMSKLKDLGVWFVGTDLSAEQGIGDIDLTGNIGLVMGSEGAGIRDLTRKHCDYLVKLPMLGMVESLNVSVSTGICLYEVARQKGLF